MNEHKRKLLAFAALICGMSVGLIATDLLSAKIVCGTVLGLSCIGAIYEVVKIVKKK